MPEFYSRLARDRLQQLSATLTTLRERVRDAVASEMGKAVGEALRELLTAILTRKPIPPPPVPVPPSESSPRNRWDDDDEQSWYDEPAVAPPRPTFEPSRDQKMTPVNALRLGVGLTSWLLQRRVPILAGLGVGLGAALATLSCNPMVQTSLAVIAAASELLAITEYASHTY